MTSLAASMNGEPGGAHPSPLPFTFSSHLTSPPHLLTSLHHTSPTHTLFLSVSCCLWQVAPAVLSLTTTSTSYPSRLTHSHSHPHLTELRLVCALCSSVNDFNTIPPSLAGGGLLCLTEGAGVTAGVHGRHSASRSSALLLPHSGPGLPVHLWARGYSVISCDCLCVRQRLCWCLWRHSQNRH